MSLRVGSRVGHFEVTGLLGVGGMGQVYRATDTKLRREVALKILPDQFASDPERLSRFEREAQALAALSHSGIAAIHGIEEFDGTIALVLELIAGPTLEDQIARHSIPLAEAVRIGSGIAAAVEAAHERGIVHRDLKPANIKIQPDGTVKVLDFGLAKVLSLGGAQGVVVAPEDPTQAAATTPGLVVGTAAYMSPEQARGEPIDERTDVWAFGCVLFEMLTGQPPFGRGRVTDLLANVLKDEPDYAALPADTPPLLRRLLRRCLTKDRRRRLRHIGDARADLEDALDAGQSASVPLGASSVAATEQRRTTATRRRVLAAAALVATAAVAGLVGWLIALRIAQETRKGEVKSFEVSDVSGPPSSSRNIAISPDGTQIQYESPEGTILRSVQHADQSQVLACGYPWFFSPDSEWIGCGGGDDQVSRLSVRGGSPTAIAAIGVEGRPLGASWGRDDRIVYATTVGLHLLAASGGKAKVLVSPDPEKGELYYSQPEILPGGGTVLFTVVPRVSTAAKKVEALDLESLERTTVVIDGAGPHYSPTGHLLYVPHSGRLHAIAFDADTLATRGDPQIVLNQEIWSNNFDVSDNGTLVYQPRESRGTGTAEILVWVDRDGRQEPLPDAPPGWMFPTISPDGKRVAGERSLPRENRDIYIWDLERKSLSRVTDNPATDIRPYWSTNGSRIFFASSRTGKLNIYSRAADGTGNDELVLASEFWTAGSGLTPDGAQLLANHLGPNQMDIVAIDLEPPSRVRPLLATPANESSASVSPDGRWIVYASDHEGQNVEIYVEPFPDVGSGRWKISTGGGVYPLWSPKGDEVFFRSPSGSMMAAQVTLEPTFARGKVTELFPNPSTGPYFLGAGTRDYDVSLDGRFLINRSVSPTASPRVGELTRGERLVVVLNWFDELKAKVPVQ